MKQDCENPWKVAAIEDFQFFCCPECDTRNHSKDDFLTHAFESHPDAKDALNDILGIKSVIEVKAENDLDPDQSSEPGELIEDIPEDNDDGDDDLFIPDTKMEVKETNIAPHIIAISKTKTAISKAKSAMFDDDYVPSDEPGQSSAFTCKTCNITFSSLTKLVGHKLSVHGSGDEKKSEIKTQQSINKIVNPNQTFRQPASSTKYVKKEPSMDQHQVHACKFCKAKYGSAADLKKHVMDRHKMVVNNPNLTVSKTESGTNNVRKAPSSTEFFHCEECNLEFSLKSSLTKHLKAYHSHVLHPCKLCKASFGSEADLEKHALEKHKLVLGGTDGDSFQCSTCNAQFMTSMQLKAHQFSQHKKVEVKSCEFCGKTFTKNFGLRLHIRKFHNKDPSEEYTCEFCGKKFGYRCNMVAHIRSKHENSRQYICDLCGMEFKYPQPFRSHMRNIHEKVRSDPCPHCQRDFHNCTQLKYHIMTVHQGIRPLECKVCGKKFAKNTNMRKHMKTHGAKDLTIATLNKVHAENYE